MTKPSSKWLGFSWELGEQSALEQKAPKPYALERATADDHEELRGAIDKSLSLDPSWNSAFHEISAWVERTMEEVLAKEGSSCLVLRHGARIIGATILDPGATEQFAVGPCVLVEYRNRGFGTLLLAAALRHLRETGATRAHAITLETSLAARFLYPKFGGKSVPSEPLLAA